MKRPKIRAYLDDREGECWVGDHGPNVGPQHPRLLIVPRFPLQQPQYNVQFRRLRPTLPDAHAIPVRQQAPSWTRGFKAPKVQQVRLWPSLILVVHLYGAGVSCPIMGWAEEDLCGRGNHDYLSLPCS